MRVFVKTDATWQALDAVPNEMGEWECIVPLTLLQKAKDRLFYFVEASAERGSASLGSEAQPLRISLFDDAGPALVRVCPADGETVAKNPPDIRVEYEDASGVDMHASAVYLDGRNVGEKAAWTANGMSFRPPTPLFCGEHLLEISLRDTRGNRTYRRFLFYVESASRTQEDSGKKSVSAVQAAGFFAGAFAVLKRLFLHKD